MSFVESLSNVALPVLSGAAIVPMIVFLYRNLVRNSERRNEILIAQLKKVIEEMSIALRRSSGSRINHPVAALDSRRSVYALEQIAGNLAKLTTIAPIAPASGDDKSTVDSQEMEKTISEISHSLNTPLQHIELTLTYLKDHSDVINASKTRLQGALDSIDICRAVMSAYRELWSIAAVGSGWDIGNLKKSILCIASSLQTQEGKLVHITVDCPPRVPGYGNYYVTALVLPLLQNAIEVSPSEEEVLFRLWQNGSSVELEISNAVTQRPDLEAMKTAGYTSKDKDSPGIGLSSVRTLLSRHHGVLEFNVDSGRISATVSLPGRLG
ncbi:sensor histidine kinase [Amycolatopsis magusensis]|uniref:sensor histidine kinase n=1 Tax=Amycolatopsis magusensis TaxID=882444 RepID=UPI0024A9F403|nr:GHKL domain-containing protein [Amycolatopsis magusensis]MDI5979610.1 GHKL domain-containing protein [Amycolatopsis magusensis]